MLYVPDAMGGTHKPVHIQRLATKSCTTFANLLEKDGDIVSHEKLQYHKDTVEGGKFGCK